MSQRWEYKTIERQVNRHYCTLPVDLCPGKVGSPWEVLHISEYVDPEIPYADRTVRYYCKRLIEDGDTS